MNLQYKFNMSSINVYCCSWNLKTNSQPAGNNVGTLVKFFSVGFYEFNDNTELHCR